jgi:head-tail adaptor
MIGNLKPIKLIQYNQSFDVYGDALEAVQTTYKMWAEIEDSGGSKNQELGRTDMTDSKTFKINFRGYLVTGDYKIQYFGQTYAVTNVQRIQEKRFNYLITAFNIFETSTGTTGGTTQNFETVTYNQVSGVFSFTNGNLNGNYLQVFIRNLAGQNYSNRWNEQTSLGPGPVSQITYPLLTPPDEVVVSWYLIAPDSPTPITPTNTANVTCERLCIRNFRIYDYDDQNSVMYYSFIDTGVYPYNVNGQQLALAIGIGEYVSIMNADPINSQYFQITSYFLEQSGLYGTNYRLTLTPVDPYYQWNPADVLLKILAKKP